MTAPEALTELGRLRQLSEGADDSVYSDQERAWIDSLHRAELGEPVRQCTCRNRYTDAVLELYIKLKRLNKMQKERQYILKRGQLIWYGADAYTCNNLTDEVAAAYLAQHPDAAHRFERIPAAEPAQPVKRAASSPKTGKTATAGVKTARTAPKSKATK